MAVKLRNRYTHDYYLREESEKLTFKRAIKIILIDWSDYSL